MKNSTKRRSQAEPGNKSKTSLKQKIIYFLSAFIRTAGAKKAGSRLRRLQVGAAAQRTASSIYG
ncbi:MAG: hypothetical protein KME49_11325 [Brasilonema octagenarum HA4186-MV1]|uniref:hypothetical protein n=1 Tax=Brasilonema TaxID=383614 RepID=UPI00145D9F9C|nr:MULTISPECIES: hypothetical protein [Brasilonema]MBW4626067.1 hypothetical protein [Brasilonema octagenarum HA4186-MV1]